MLGNEIDGSEEKAGWLGLLMTAGLGTRGIQRLYSDFGGIQAIYRASLTELEACGLPAAVAQSLFDGSALERGGEEWQRAQANKIDVVTLSDREYPELLREIHDPPPVLYVRGSVAALDTFGIAVVGTRHPTVYGRLMAEKLSAGLAPWGLTIFSGLARGVDGIAHKACVEAGGVTVAVLGTGLDLVYPREHQKLADRILEQRGALVSEFPLGTFPAPQNFPIRNRIISGLALGVLVVEGGEFSGSRITARLALEQNREVFAVPGQVTQKQAWLPNALIKQGGKLVTEVADIIEELPSAARLRLQPPEGAEAGSPAGTEDGLPEADVRQVSVLSALQVETPSHVDEIVDRLENKLTAPEILALLFDLELAGKVRQLPGKNYVRVC